MKLILLIAVAVLSAVPVLAETYSWTDNSGTMNFTEDYSQVPKQYRKKIEIRRNGDNKPSSAETPAVAKGVAKSAPVVPAKELEIPKAKVTEDTYGGKSMDVWQRELTAAEAESKALFAKVKEQEAQMNKPGENPDGLSRNELIRRYNSAVTEYNAANARFSEMLTAARKAGVPL